MKVLVTGDREDRGYQAIIFEVLEMLWHHHPNDLIVVHGAARGVDSLADSICKVLGIETKPYPADWDSYGKAAGPIRNQQMLDDNADIELGLAFHYDILQSKGTKDMVKRLVKSGITTKLYNITELEKVFNPPQLEFEI